MGYTTDFAGEFQITPNLKPEHAAYLRDFQRTRRMQRNPTLTATLPDPIRAAAGLPIGEDAGFYVGSTGPFGQARTPDIIDYNEPPKGQPHLWCQWEPKGGSGSISNSRKTGGRIAFAICIVLAIVIVVAVGDASKYKRLVGANEYGKVQKACVPCPIVHVTIFHDSPHSYPVSRFGNINRNLQRITWSNQRVGNSNVGSDGLGARAHILNRPYDLAVHREFIDSRWSLPNVSYDNIGSVSEASGYVITATNANYYPRPLRIHQRQGVFARSLSGLFGNLSLPIEDYQSNPRNDDVDGCQDGHYPLTVSHKWPKFFLGCLLAGAAGFCIYWGSNAWLDRRNWAVWGSLLILALILWVMGFGLIINTY